VPGEYYHIYNRGVDKRDIFNDRKDIYRFLESMQEFNQTDVIGSIRDLRKSKSESKAQAGVKKPWVSIVAYCLNPNHFHFILKQEIDGGISRFMQKLQGGYTYYFNAKNLRTGSLFQGTFKSHLVNEENYFHKMLGYVNKNYQIHDIPIDKKDLVFASDYEYKSSNFKFVSKAEGRNFLEVFGGSKNFEKHCNEIVSIVRVERGKTSLLDEEEIPDRV